MAAQLVTTIKRYIGTAAEIAAMTLTGIPTGSTFFESDTGILKVLNAAGALVTAPSESVQLSGSNTADGSTVNAVSVVLDANGDPCIRMVDAAPFAYDDVNNKYLITGIVSEGKAVKIATAVEFRTTDSQLFNLITHGGMTAAEIRRYKRFKISIYNTHDVAAKITLYDAFMVSAGAPAAIGPAVYTEDAVVPATSGSLTLTGKAGGTGVANLRKIVPELDNGIFSNLFVKVVFASAPTTGALSIAIEMGM